MTGVAAAHAFGQHPAAMGRSVRTRVDGDATRGARAWGLCACLVSRPLRAHAGAWLVLVLIAHGATSPHAHADPPEPGTWRAGTTSTDVAIKSWGPDCGPAPRSATSPGGGTVRLHREGPTIVLIAGDRTVRSNQCWSQNPGVRRVANTERPGVWTTTCATAPNDPREEHGSYTLKLLPDGSLLYQDVSRYDWRLKNSSCAATATTTQALTRVPGTAAATGPAAQPVAPPSAPAEPPAKLEVVPTCQPGPAARIALRPAQATIEVGRRVCFRPSVTDANGCPLPEATVRWSLEHDPSIKGRIEDGCFVAGDQAAESEGQFRVIAAIGSLRADAPVSVRTPDLSALLAQRIETGALPAESARAPELPPEAPVASAAKVAAAPAPPPAGKHTASGHFALALVLAGAFGVAIAAWLLVRRRAARESAGAQTRASVRPATPVAGSVAPRSAAPEEPWICPTCRVGYPKASGTCPKDGTALVPYRQFADARRSLQPASGKRCPRCGRLYPDSAAFCSEDGAPLA